MSDDFEDYIVKRRSREEIEAIAEALARRHGISGPVTKIVEVLRAETLSAFSLLSGWRIVERSLVDMPRDEGRADFSQKMLEFREGVLENAESGRHRDKMTVAHELGHVLLDHKHGGIMHRVQQGNSKLGFGRQAESAEWQATYFAAAFLMPRPIVRDCSNATEVSLRCRVSLQAAQIRFDEVNVRGVAKQTPPDIQAGIEQLKTSVRDSGTRPVRKTVLPPEVEQKLCWELAPKHPEHDAESFRVIDDKYVVMKSRFGRAMVGGWTIEAGKIVPWESRNP